MGYGPDIIAGGVASANSTWNDYFPPRACDDNVNTDWRCWHNYPNWWKYDFGAGVTKVVTRITIRPYETNALKSFTFQGSNNDADWDTLYTGECPAAEAVHTFSFANTTAYRYYRIYITNNWRGNTWTGIDEVEFMESEPVAPSGCATAYVATNNAKCTWNDNSANETGFRIEKAIDGGGYSFWKNVGAGVTDSGTYTLGANHRIIFRVCAYNAVGNSAFSTSPSYIYTTPAAPTGATTVYVATNNAKLTWTDASAYESGFKLQYAIGAGGWADWKTVGAGVQDSGNYSAGANTRIKFRVCAYRGALYSAYSEGSYVYTIPTTPSGINLSWLSQDETVRIAWTDNSAYEQDFDIERAIDVGGFAHIVYDAASPYDDTGPAGLDHRYQYRVRARCPDGRLSGWNTSGYIYSTPAAPSGCSIALGTINVSWTDNSTYEDGFQVERQLDGGGWVLVYTTAAEAEFWADASQPTGANIKYEYRVRAKIGTLFSTYSASNLLFAKIFSETIALSDSFSRAWNIYRTFTESINLSDTYSKVCNWFRIFIESITLADILQKKPAKTFTENLTLADTLQKKPAKVFTEAITLTDIYSRVWSIYRTFTETLNLADTLIKKPIKTFIESLHLTDTLLKRPGKVFSETLNLSDSLIKKAIKTFSESLSLSDTVRKRISKTFTEKINLKDTYTRVVIWYRTFTEKITLIDTVKKVKSNLIQLWKKLMNLFDIEG